MREWRFQFLDMISLLYKMKKALNDDSEVKTSGKHQYKVILKKTKKRLPCLTMVSCRITFQKLSVRSLE